MGLDGGNLYLDRDKKKEPKKFWVVVMMCWGAAILLWLMLSGFTQPFSGVEMRGQVKSLDQISELAQTPVQHFVLAVVRFPHRDNYEVVMYLNPGDDVGIVGISYNWYKIRVGNLEGWVNKMFINDNINDFINKGRK